MNIARHILRTPAHILARLRRLDDVLDYTSTQNAASGYSSTISDANTRLHQRAVTRETGAVPIPGPWGFLTSGYFVGLFFMAFVLNRVQNMVVPPRHPAVFRHLRGPSERGSTWRNVFRLLFPMDISSTFSCFVFRLPSIFFLLRSLILWSFICLQGAGIFLPPRFSFFRALDHWAAQKEMEDLCWQTFIAVCFALFIGALTGGMEGLYTSSNSPFNLFGYSFTLYIYASPMTHTFKTKGGASRPDVHVIFTMIVPLLQLTMTHCLEVNRRWARQRLIPTTICSLLSLIHFHLVMWFFPSSYPLPTMVPNVVESFLLMVTTITCALNALTQLLLNGAITKPLFGHTATLMPKWDEDFSVVLFRLGTASLEATSVAGYGNEVGGVMRPRADLVVGPASAAPKETTVKISPAGLVSVVPGVDDRGKLIRLNPGFSNEIKHVKASSRNTEVWADPLVNVLWHRELGRFVSGLWRYVSAWSRYLWGRLRGRKVKQELSHETADSMPASRDVEHESESDAYERFLRGETLSDDDEEFEPAVVARRDRESTPLEDEDEDAENDDGSSESEDEAVQLFADLSQAASSSASAPLLLAHMTDTSSSPLTRRRYARLLRVPQAEQMSEAMDEWSSFVSERRQVKQGLLNNDPMSGNRQLCVICTVEPREIICWPCRCLALCDDCRENLASRSSASKHLCPCCRTNVEGYSKIFTP